MRLASLTALVLSTVLHAAPDPAWGPIELVRDRWGTPHVFSDTDEGAMYGLGQAVAEDRLLQMTLALRIMQGRLAETVGIVNHVRRRDTTSLTSDRKMRTFGWARAADARAKSLDAGTRALLAAYCRGIDDWVAANPGRLPPHFARLGITHEPWTPAHCLLSWWHLAQFFATDGTRDLIAWRHRDRQRPAQPTVEDPRAMVIRTADADAAWLARCRAFAEKHGLVEPAKSDDPGKGPKYSHAWVVGKARTTTGSAVLVSDPQTPVRNPSIWHEYHVKGKTFDARGVGVPGCPTLLIGWSRHVAWGLTALGADQADLFRLKTDADHLDQYHFDGAWRKMTVRRETIKVRGGEDRPWVVRETHLGPVVTRFCFARPGDPEVALKRVPLVDNGRCSLVAGFAMMRATDVPTFDKALAQWQFPSANVVYGDAAGRIGYRALAAVPIRHRKARRFGRMAHDGTRSEHDWQGWVPHDLMPHLIDAKRGFLQSGNHRPIGPFYPIPIGISTGSGGDTDRSWRLRELLEARKRFTPEQVLAVHFDATHAPKRELVRLASHLAKTGAKLSPDSLAALKILAPWLAGGARSDLRVEGAALASRVGTGFRFYATTLAGTYGGGQSGMARWLRDVAGRLTRDAPTFTDAERQYVDTALARAWRDARASWGPDPTTWAAKARADVTRRTLGYQQSLDGWPSLDRALDLKVPPLHNLDGGTIGCQHAQSYTQYVPLHDVDAARSILPIGASERPGDPGRTAAMAAWSKGTLHPAPLSRDKVLALASGTPRRLDAAK